MSTIAAVLAAASAFFSISAIVLGTGEREERWGLQGFGVAASVAGVGFFGILWWVTAFGPA